ncbi:hypothetical protein ACPF04_06095 [Campylobacter sp. MOP51]
MFKILIVLFLFKASLVANNVDEKDYSPGEIVYKEKLVDVNLYTRYAQYFTTHRAGGDKRKVFQILGTEDDYLRYFESILKGLYNYYYDDKEIGIKMMLRAYDRAYDKLKNSFEGIMVQSIFLKEGLFDKTNIITTSTYCKGIVIFTDELACLSDYVASLGVRNDDLYTLELYNLNIKNDKMAKRVHAFIEKNKKE